MNDHVRIDITPPQRVLVTGASGFIGGRLVRRLIERQAHVSCLVRSSSHIDDLRATGADLIVGDVNDHVSVERALAQSQARTVFHLAGLVRALHRDDFMRANASGVENVAAACARCAAPPALIVVSSLAAAGPCDVAGEQRVEGDAPAPVSHYGHSKLAGEQAATRYGDAVPITIVRPPIVYGSGDRAVLEMIRPIARRGLHVVPGPRGADRRFSLIHVDDLVEGLLLAAEKGERLTAHESPCGQGIYFLAGQECPTYVELGQAMAIALERKPPKLLYVPRPIMRFAGILADMTAWIRRRPGWGSRDKITEALAGSWTCSSAKAHTQLGWKPAGDLAQRLRETVQGYQQAKWL